MLRYCAPPPATGAAQPVHRIRPGDPSWPSDASWDRLGREVLGRLITVESPLTACHMAPEGASCAEVLKALNNPYAIGDHPALTQTSGWVDAWTSAPSVYGVAMLGRGDYLGVALIVFGAIGGSLCAADLRGKQGDERARIVSHLTRMLAATIATLTAFLVTNVTVEPALVIWLLPTIVMTPVIALWNRRIMSGYRPQGMPSGDPGARQS